PACAGTADPRLISRSRGNEKCRALWAGGRGLLEDCVVDLRVGLDALGDELAEVALALTDLDDARMPLASDGRGVVDQADLERTPFGAGGDHADGLEPILVDPELRPAGVARLPADDVGDAAAGPAELDRLRVDPEGAHQAVDRLL